jgi:hypothetical protein
VLYCNPAVTPNAVTPTRTGCLLNGLLGCCQLSLLLCKGSVLTPRCACCARTFAACTGFLRRGSSLLRDGRRTYVSMSHSVVSSALGTMCGAHYAPQCVAPLCVQTAGPCMP